jgi:uncharacterized protein YdaU (DUF1376 family)
MSSKVDGWMPLHVGAYIAATRHLSAAEHGMYLLLLMHAWNNAGVIPGEEDRLQRICSVTAKEWAKARAVILDFLTKQEDGTYRQKRLDAELARSLGLKADRSDAGAKGAANRWQKHSKAMATPVASDMANECPIPVTNTTNQNSPPSPPPGGRSVDKSKGGQWWLTPEGIAAEGKRVGVEARTGESYGAYAQRIRAARATA